MTLVADRHRRSELTLREIAAQLERMRERTPAAASVAASSVKHLLDRARRLARRAGAARRLNLRAPLAPTLQAIEPLSTEDGAGSLRARRRGDRRNVERSPIQACRDSARGRPIADAKA